jgi:hypothetical protein
MIPPEGGVVLPLRSVSVDEEPSKKDLPLLSRVDAGGV